MAALFLEGQADVRSATAFEQRLHEHRATLLLKAEELANTAQSVMQLYADAQTRLKACRSASVRDDIQRQLGCLLYRGFWRVTPYRQLRELPRYLKAVLHRLEKAAQDPLRDLKQFKEIEPFLERYWTAVRAAHGRWVPEIDPFRWQLEELRVSLFAQQLKTPYPVSAKRMQEAWAQRAAEKPGR